MLSRGKGTRNKNAGTWRGFWEILEDSKRNLEEEELSWELEGESSNVSYNHHFYELLSSLVFAFLVPFSYIYLY